MRRRPELRILLATALALVPPGTASGAVPLTPQANSPWSVVPSFSEGRPQRTALTYVLAPGGAVRDSIRLQALGSEPVEVTLAAANGRSSGKGRLELVAGPSAREIKGWVSLEPATVQLQPGQSTEVAVAIDVPQDATPGDAVGGILATSVTQTAGAGAEVVTATRSQGVRINVRIEGPIEPTVDVRSITMEIDESVNPFAASDLNVRYVLHNTGNIRLGVDQSIGVRSLFGDVKSTPPAIPELLPGDKVEVSHRVAGAVRFGRAVATVVLTPHTAFEGEILEPQPPSASRSAALWAIPWILLTELSLVLIICTGVVRAMARKRRRSTRPS